MEVVALNCPKCGASLDVPEGVGEIRCKFCGSRSAVRETTSVRALQLMREDMQDIRSDVDSLVKSRDTMLKRWESAEFELYQEWKRLDEAARKHSLAGIPILAVGLLSGIAGFWFMAHEEEWVLYVVVGLALVVLGAALCGTGNKRRSEAEELEEQLKKHRQRKPVLATENV